MREAGRPFEGPQRAVELAFPPVRLGQSMRGLLVDGNERGERAQALSVGRSLLDRPGEGGERPPRRRSAHVVFCKKAADLVPEGARFARPTLVVRRLADEIESPRGPRAGRVEEVAVALDRVRSRQPRPAQARVELARRFLVEERRALAAARQRALLEAEHEDDLVAPRAGAQKVDDVYPPRLSSTGSANLGAFERGHDLVRSQRPAEREPALELPDQPIEGLERPQILARFLADRGRLESVGGTEHEASKVEQSGERRLSLAEELERRQRVAVPEPHRLLLGALARLDGAAPEPALDPVDARSGEARIGRAEETVQLTAPAALPGKPEQRQQGAPELGLVESDLPLDRVGHAEGAERGLERCPIPLDAGADEGNLLRARVRADQRQQLLGDALERPTAAGAFEEAKRAVDFRGFGARCRGEQPSLEVREGRWAHIG